MNETLFIGSSLSYVDTNGIVGVSDWALKVSSASWGYFPNDATFDNEVAVLASAFPFISMPTEFYKNIEDVLKRN